jgi:hypothetical protein
MIEHGHMLVPGTCGGKVSNGVEGKVLFGSIPNAFSIECLKLKSPAVWGFQIINEPNKSTTPLEASWSWHTLIAAGGDCAACYASSIYCQCGSTGPYD